MRKLEGRRRIAVALGFLTFIALSLIASEVLHSVPSPAEACERRCATFGKRGVLEYNGPATTKEMSKALNSDCRCQ